MSKDNTTPNEPGTANDEANTGVDAYVHTFDKPITSEGEEIKELTFEFGRLTANDALAIERELGTVGVTSMVPEFSGEYLLRMAVRACTYQRSDGRKLGVDAFCAFPMADFVRIRGKARSFLLRVGS